MDKIHSTKNIAFASIMLLWKRVLYLRRMYRPTVTKKKQVFLRNQRFGMIRISVSEI